jgi:hypothetical protein
VIADGCAARTARLADTGNILAREYGLCTPETAQVEVLGALPHRSAFAVAMAEAFVV